jgi:hypothetical protein
LGFREPTKIILTYEVFENRFRMTVVKNGATEILPTDEPDDDCVVIPNPEGYQPVETIANEEVEDYVNVSNFGGCSQPVDTFIDEEDGHDQSPPEFLTGAMRKFPAFNDDRKFGWRLTISHAYATSTKHQVLVSFFLLCLTMYFLDFNALCNYWFVLHV